MGKRVSNITDDGAAAFRKRQKITHEVPSGEDVTSGEHLRQLLSFDQNLTNTRHGLQSFKRLLDSINSGEGDQSAQIDILRQYLEAAKPRLISEDAVYLGDIMEAWSFAVQVNDVGVMSSAAVVLALLLQAVSGSLSLVSHGLGVCQTLLQESQLKSLSKNLSVEKSKGFIISPTLRLLREAVCLDGGAYAKRIFRARQSTFTALGRNLEVGNATDSEDDARKVSVRTNAVRFFMSCLKYLHSDGRKELLLQKELVSHLTFMIKSDPPHLVLEILDGLKSHGLMDDKIPRDVKFKCFNTKTLMRVLGLYTYTSALGEPEQVNTVNEKAHEFLVFVCTKPSAGLLYPSTGLYPKPSDDESYHRNKKGAPGPAGALTNDDFSNGIPVYNFVLSDFAQKLKPWSALKHNELLVAMFTAAPELVADYFLNNRSFTFEPKLSMTWIGYAAFLFNTMQIPLPPSFGDRVRYAHTPPPTSILLDNVIPLPINQKVLVRCLSNNSNLTSFFATRILVVALEKLAEAIKMLEGPSRSGVPVWSEASQRLTDAFCQRVPDMKEIVRAYKSVPAENFLHKTLASRLLRLYYETIPRVALAANFDVAPLFVDVLKTLNQGSGHNEAKSFGVMELEDLVSIASYSPGMRWFSKVESISGGASLSPFTALLRLLCSDNHNTPSKKLRKILNTIAVESQLIAKATSLSPLLRALSCAQGVNEVSSMKAVWTFLDNCINRCATSPIKYVDMTQSHLADIELDDNACTLLSVGILEQLPFATSSLSKPESSSLARFLSLYFNAFSLSKESKSLNEVLYKKIREHLSEASLKPKHLGSKSEIELLKSSPLQADVEEETAVAASETKKTLDDSKLEETLHVLSPSGDETSALVKWTSKSVEDLIEDGHAAKLIRLLTSSHTNIRKEALTNIFKMAGKIKESSYEEKDQIWLLLSEVVESSRAQVDIGPVPSGLTAFATHSLEVLRNPLHPLYPKINTFLTRSPVWGLEKLPLAHDVLHGEPSEDDRYYTEITWLLAYLLDGLVTAADLAVLHKKRWFEKILVLGANPYLRWNLRVRILRIIYRATRIETGSTTLVTRFGVLSWLDAQRSGCEVQEEKMVYEALMRRVWETCDQTRVKGWSKDGAVKLLEGISTS